MLNISLFELIDEGDVAVFVVVVVLSFQLIAMMSLLLTQTTIYHGCLVDQRLFDIFVTKRAQFY